MAKNPDSESRGSGNLSKIITYVFTVDDSRFQAASKKIVKRLEAITHKLTGNQLRLDKMTKTLNSSSRARKKQTSSTNASTKSTNKNSKSISKNTQAYMKQHKVLKGITSLFSRLSGRILKGVSTLLGSLFADALTDSIEYVESLNLFRVALGDLSDEADNFINTMSEAFGLDPAYLRRSMGTFQALAESMELPQEQAYLLSTTFTKLGVDLASLWNTSIDTAWESLQGAMTGITRPIRSNYGVDISAESLQATLNTYGIDATARSLSATNKVALRFITIMDHVKSSMGDMSKTIETPANQLRIFTQQWSILSRTIGDFFLGTLRKVLPYLNALVMTINAVLRSFASLMGIQEGDFASAITGGTDAAVDFGDAIEDAEDKAKNFTLPFDELNVIKPEDSSTGGTTGGLGSGISQELLALMKGYDNLMGQVKMKATQLRDRWMEILGFEKLINEETGEISWKFKGLPTPIKILGGLLGGALIYGALINISAIVHKITSTFYDLVGIVGKVSGVFNALYFLITWAVFGIINQWDNVVKSIKQAGTGIIQIFQGVVEFGVSVFGFMVGILLGDFDLVDQKMKAMGEGLKTFFFGIINSFIGLVQTVMYILTGMINVVIQGINLLIDAVNAVIGTRLVQNVLGRLGVSRDFRVSKIAELEIVAMPNIEDILRENNRIVNGGAAKTARGGILEGGQPFIAGERGRRELVGDYQGKTTVMPLENTSFVGAIREAVREGVSDATLSNSNNSGTPVVHVYIGNEELDSYIFKSYNKTKRARGTQLFGGVLNE